MWNLTYFVMLGDICAGEGASRGLSGMSWYPFLLTKATTKRYSGFERTVMRTWFLGDETVAGLHGGKHRTSKTHWACWCTRQSMHRTLRTAWVGWFMGQSVHRTLKLPRVCCRMRQSVHRTLKTPWAWSWMTNAPQGTCYTMIIVTRLATWRCEVTSADTTNMLHFCVQKIQNSRTFTKYM